MNEEIIIEKLNDIFKETLSDDTITLTKGTTADDIEDWDSISHVQLIFSIETEFNITFNKQEVISLIDIDSIVNVVKNKTS